jgi:hypothetical protein
MPNPAQPRITRCCRLAPYVLPAGVLLFAATALRAARNLAPNPSFESSTAHWQLWSEPGPQPATLTRHGEGRHGTACVSVRAGTGRAVLSSDPIPVNGGADYTLSAYVRTEGASGAHLSLWIQGKGETAGAWAPADVAAGQQQNLFANAGFEDGEAGWRVWHGAPGVSSGAVVDGGRNGGKAFLVTNPGTEGANLHSDPVPCTAGKVYSLFVYAKTLKARKAGVSVWARDAAGKTLSYAVGGSVEVPSDLPDYRLFCTTVTAPEGAVELKAHLVCNGGKVWWDDCRLVPRDESQGYELRGYLELPAEQPAWARFKHIVQPPADCKAARILLISGSGEVHWDAVQLEPGRDTSPYTHMRPTAGPNLLPNSGFEAGDNGWELWHQHPGRSTGAITVLGPVSMFGVGLRSAENVFVASSHSREQVFTQRPRCAVNSNTERSGRRGNEVGIVTVG